MSGCRTHAQLFEKAINGEHDRSTYRKISWGKLVELLNLPLLRGVGDSSESDSESSTSTEGSDSDADIESVSSALSDALHIVGSHTCKCRPSKFSTWKDWFLRGDHLFSSKVRLPWPEKCCFEHIVRIGDHTYRSRCTGTASVGAHIKARQRFWIVPSCSGCNGRHGTRMKVDKEFLVCPLPTRCLCIFINGGTQMSAAPRYVRTETN